MPKPSSRPAIRRFVLYSLILLALALVSGVIFVIVTDDAILASDDAFPELVIVDPEKRPRFDFPEAARTFDLSLNQFVDRFARVCMEGRYSDFRLMLSRRRPPILPPRFEANFNALKNVRILSIEKVPLGPDSPSPVYVMKAEYELKDFAVRQGQRTREVHVAIAREEGEWRIGPIPREALAQLRARESPQTPAKPTPSAEPPVPRHAAPNRPAKLQS